jgi:hypothetical protein
MLDADMQIVALRPTGFFGFDLDRYKQAAGCRIFANARGFGTRGFHGECRNGVDQGIRQNVRATREDTLDHDL